MLVLQMEAYLGHSKVKQNQTGSESVDIAQPLKFSSLWHHSLACGFSLMFCQEYGYVWITM